MKLTLENSYTFSSREGDCKHGSENLVKIFRFSNRQPIWSMWQLSYKVIETTMAVVETDYTSNLADSDRSSLSKVIDKQWLQNFKESSRRLFFESHASTWMPTFLVWTWMNRATGLCELGWTWLLTCLNMAVGLQYNGLKCVVITMLWWLFCDHWS